jgi:phospholipid/cholesterol/gamma-HCH transport system permease protein
MADSTTQAANRATGADPARIGLDRSDDQRTLVIGLGGSWTLTGRLPSTDVVEQALAVAPEVHRIAFDSSELSGWDSSLLTLVSGVGALGRQQDIEVDRSSLPEGVLRLLALAEAVPEVEDARAVQGEAPVLDRIGSVTISAGRSFAEGLDFLGAATLAFFKVLGGRARFRRVDLWLMIQQAGAEALGIVTLVAFLLGLILAFVGAIQLRQFGATIYVADLVGVAMVRDMGALITAIVMAGRSGAAYAAQLGSMKVTQEIDALTTMGISPMEYLVMPRVIALFTMMPLLTIYADFVGIIGGGAVGTTMLDISATAYVQQTMSAISVADILGGVLKGTVYGLLVGLAGCLRGMQAERSSSGVGDAATSAVVTSIVAIIAAAGVFQFVFYVLEI